MNENKRKTNFFAADMLIAPYIGGTQSAVASWGLGFGLPLIVSDKVAAGITDQNKHLVTVTPAGDHYQLAQTLEKFIKGQLEGQPLPQKLAKHEDSWDDLIETLTSFEKTSS